MFLTSEFFPFAVLFDLKTPTAREVALPVCYIRPVLEIDHLYHVI